MSHSARNTRSAPRTSTRKSCTSATRAPAGPLSSSVIEGGEPIRGVIVPRPCGSEWTRATSRPGAAWPAIRARCSARSRRRTRRTSGSPSSPGAGRAPRPAGAAAAPEDECLAFAPGRERVRAPAGVRVVRHRLPGRALFGAAAVARRPRLDRLLGGVDVVWTPAPAPLAVSSGVPLVLTVHDRSFEERPGDFTPYERVWHRLARPRALAARASAVVCDAEVVRDDLARAWGVRATVVAPGRLETGPSAAPLHPPRPYLL